MKTFNISILPRATRNNIDRLDLVVAQPSLDFSGDKFGTIVTADIAGHPILNHGLLQHASDLTSGELPFDLDG